jgi:uncharacterized protein YndB with AHSA1/START domain
VEPIRRTITLSSAPADAFRVFTEGMADWWPRAYTWSVDDLERIVVEPWQGGRWYEVRRGGREEVWGTVLEWDAPARVTFSWQIRADRTPEPDLSRASQVDIRFFEEGPGETRFELTHDGFARHGGAAAQYRAGMDAPEGWTAILASYTEAVAQLNGESPS